MKCNDASRLIVRSMFGGLPQGDRQALEEHIYACEDCRRRAAHYGCIRDEVAAMEPTALPPEAREVLLEGLREAHPEPEGRPRPPADPKPESSTLLRALLVVSSMLALGLLTFGLLSMFRGEMKPIPAAATVAYRSGTVQARAADAGMWHEFLPGDPVLPGTALHTEQDGVVALTSGDVDWWMDGSTALAFGDPGTAELAQGRICVGCPARDNGPITLLTQAGTVTCAGGEFVATMSGTRLTLACLSGRADVGEVHLESGQEGLLAEGKLIGPMRPVGEAASTHWMLRLTSGYGEALTPRRLAAVPLAPRQPALPDGVSIADLSVELTARGPLVLVGLSGRLENTGARHLQARLSADGLMLPRPLAQTGPVTVDLPAHESGSFRLSAVCALPERAGRHLLGINLLAWTGSSIGQVGVHLDAAGDGGLREVALPVQGFDVRRRDSVSWSWNAELVPPGEPIVLEMELAGPARADTLALGDRALCAWRPDASAAWIGKGRRVLLAFDATADYGPAGRSGAQDVVETLLGALPPAVPTALAAYDGALRLDRDPWAANLPPRVDSLLASLWRIADGGDQAHAGDFVARAFELAAAGQGQMQTVFIYMTGAGGPADPSAIDGLAPAPGVRVVVVQVGARRVADAYGRLCARSGGAALAIDPDEDPHLAGYDLLMALQSAAVNAPALEGAAGTVLSGPAAFANEPVVALVPRQEGCVLSAEVDGKRLRQQVRAAPGPDATGPDGLALLGVLQRQAGP
jgi:hypothetical protein